MDSQFKAIVVFDSKGASVPSGWTETWYVPGAVLKDAVGWVLGYVKVRKEVLGVGASIKGFKVTDVLLLNADGKHQRNANTTQLFGNDGIGQTFTRIDDDAYDPTQVDLLINVFAGDKAQFRRQWWLGGLPDSQTNQLVSQGMQAGFINHPAFKRLLNYVIINPRALIRRIHKKPDDTFDIGFEPVTDAKPRMVRNRKRGRPFDLFHGKRSN